MSETRTIWASSRARAVWEPRIRAIQAAWVKVEINSVRANMREAALVFGEPIAPLPIICVAENRYAIGCGAKALEIAYRACDDNMVGSLLGYPECCRHFFERVKLPGDVDTTWEMSRVPSTDGPIECNILGRWLGVRLVPHLPCSFNCTATVDFAKRLEPLWPTQELAWAKEILSWPMEWSANHGVAEVKWPILKCMTPTTVAGQRVVQRQGTGYPSEGAQGVSFPYTEKKARQDGLGTAQSLPILAPSQAAERRSYGILASRPESENARLWTDNGFVSREAMDAAHDMILKAIDGVSHDSVLDLGAGNGQLLSKIVADTKAGIEMDVDRVYRAQKTIAGIEMVWGRIESSLLAGPFDVVIIASRRFDEMDDRHCKKVRSWLADHTRYVLIYSYDEPMYARLEDAHVYQA